MSSVDERIVQMQFDNAKFENGVSTTINSIDKLKQSLQFNDVGKGFDNITKAASSVDLTAVQNSIDAIEQKFSIVSEAIRRNVGKVIDGLIGKATQLANALFVAPRTDGFKEYELKMDSVQTILSTTDATLEDVNARLDELNAYADKTIYSFSDMTQSIGKFTNAGVDLDDAVLAIKGISNAAAKSGAKTQQASSAMYNFAQALGTGALMMQDWKSIELAGMASPEFKQQLVDTALALGTLVKQGDKYVTTTTNGQGSTASFSESLEGFRDTLSSRWITNDVLIETLKKYTDETTELGKKAYAAATEVKTFSQLIDTAKEAMGSGWSQTFEIVIGDFGEAKEIFTALSGLFDSIINKTAAVRNGFLKAWKDDGGREKLVKHLETIISQVDILSDKILKNLLGSKYNKILGETNDILDDTSKKIDNLTEAERKFIEEVWKEGKHGTGEQRAEEARQAGVNYERVQDVLNKIANNEMTIDSLAENTAENTEKTAKAVEQIGDTKWSKALENVLTTVKFLGKSLLNIGETIFNIGKLFIQAFVEEFAIDDVTLGIKQFARYLMQTTGRIKDWSKDSSGLLTIFRGIFKFANALWTVFKPFLIFAGKAIRQLATWLVNIGEAIDNWSKKIDENSRLYRAWNAIKKIAGKVKDAFLDMFNQLGEAAETNPKIKQLRDFFSGIADKVKDIFDSGFTKFVEFLERIADGDISFNNIKEMVSNFGKGESKVGGFFDKFKDGVDGLDKVKTAFEKIKNNLSDDSIKDVGSRAYKFIASIATNVGAALKNIDWSKVMEYMKFGAFLAIMYKLYSFISGLKDITKNFNTGLVDILGSISKTIGSFGTYISAKAVKEIAESVAILGGTLILLSMIPSETLKNVASSVSLVILMLALLAKALTGVIPGISKSSDYLGSIKIDGFLLGIAFIFYTMYKILEFAATSEGDMTKGLGVVLAITTALAVFTLFLAGIQKIAGPRLSATVTSLKRISSVLLIMTGVLFAVAYMVDNYSDAVAAAFLLVSGLGVILLLMALASAAVKTDNLISMSVGMLIMGVAITALIPPLVALSMIKTDRLAKGIGALALLALTLSVMSRIAKNTGSFLSIAAGIYIITKAIVYLGENVETALNGTYALITLLALLTTISMVGSVFASGILLFGQAIMWVSSALLVGAAAFWILADGIEKAANALPNFAEGIVILASQIASNAPMISSSIGVVILALTDALKKSTPSILKALRALLDEIFVFLIDPSHGIIGMLLDVIENILEMLASIVDRLVDLLIKFIIDLMIAIGDAVNSNLGELANATTYLVESLTNLLVTVLAAIVDGVVNGILGKFGVKLNLADKVAQQITYEKGEIARGAGKTYGTGNDLKRFKDAGENLGSSYGTAYSDGFSTGIQGVVNNSLGQIERMDFFKSVGSTPMTYPLPVGEVIPEMKVTSISVDNNKMSKALKDLGIDTGTDFKDGVVQGSQINLDDMNSYIENYSDIPLGGVGFGLGTDYGSGITEGFESEMFAFDGEDTTLRWADEFKQPDEFQVIGSDNAKSFTNGLEENRGPIKRKSTQLANTVKEVFESKNAEYFATGINAIQGFIDGINHKSSELEETAILIANKVKNAFSGKRGLDEHSPSKVFMTYGEYASEGFIVGLTSYADRITESSSAVANSAVDALKTPLQHITDIIDGTLDVDPTIRPVMDLTDIQNGSQMIDGMFANRSVQLAGINDKLNGLNVDANLRDKKSANNDIVEELRTLRSGFADMSQRLDNMQVVMDSGQLVGAISAPMDRSLGNRSIRKGRRN